MEGRFLGCPFKELRFRSDVYVGGGKYVAEETVVEF